MQTLDEVWRTCQEQWMIGMKRERERENQGNLCSQRNLMKIRIDVKEEEINKCREVLIGILNSTAYCYYAVCKKIKCNNCKNLISGRDNMGEIIEIKLFSKDSLRFFLTF